MSTEDKLFELLKRNEDLERELTAFRSKAPLVGVRFYGQGGFGIGLSVMIGGANRVSLEGYNSKGVIDYSAWLRVRGTEEARAGILVRDDSVISELGVVGVVAEAEKKVNNNAFTDAQIMDILKNSSIKQLKTIADKMTHHFSPKHFVDCAKMNGFTDRSKLAIFEERHNILFTYFKWDLLNIHDLRLACEIQKVPFDGKEREVLVKELSDLEIKMLGQE